MLQSVSDLFFNKTSYIQRERSATLSEEMKREGRKEEKRRSLKDFLNISARLNALGRGGEGDLSRKLTTERR